MTTTRNKIYPEHQLMETDASQEGNEEERRDYSYTNSLKLLNLSMKITPRYGLNLFSLTVIFFKSMSKTELKTGKCQ